MNAKSKHDTSPTALQALSAPVQCDVVLNIKQTSVMTGLSTRQLERGMSSGEGPRYVRLSPRRIGFRRSDIEAWLASRTFSTLSEEMARAA